MRTAVIGTGIMGAGMAGSLAREGHDVVVWNRSPEKADALAGDRISVAASVTDAVTGADLVLTALYDGSSVLAVADEIVAALAPHAVWLQSATVGPDAAREIGAKAPGRVLDAPVLGTRKPAEDGTLVVLVSGPATLLEAARPALEALGSRTIEIGADVGLASALKLAANSWVGLLTVGTAQALGLAQSLGVDPALFLDAIAGGAVDTPYAHVKGAAMLTSLARASAQDAGGAEAPVSFALDGVRKDLQLMVESAQGVGFPDDLLAAVLGVYDRASGQGHGSEDMAAVIEAFRSR